MTVRIVIADDHELFREALRPLLEKEGGLQVVGEAGDGWEAVAAVDELSPDMVLMDIGMPHLNGIDATRHLLERHPHLQVVAVTARTDRASVVDMLAAGAVAYVPKCAPFDDLIHAVRAACRGQRYVSSVVTGALLGHPADRSPSGAAMPAEPLAQREREVLQLVAEGESSKTIAERLHIAPSTVDTYRRSIARKLDLHSVAEQTKYAIRAGITPLE